MRLAAAIGALVLAAACGGPPIGEKIPRPDPNAVAVGAAAAAAAATLADPNSAGKKPESKDSTPSGKPVRVKETVPETVLDRSDSGEAEEDLPPCEPDQSEGSTGAEANKGDKSPPRRLDLIPAPVSDIPQRDTAPAERKKCRPANDEDDDQTTER